MDESKEAGEKGAAVKEQRNKATICATVSPWLKTRLEQMANGEDLSSVSEIVSLACHEFMIRYFSENKEKQAAAEKSEKSKSSASD